MSTAMNHRKRSHRSNFRSRAFNGSRRAVVKPTLKRSFFGQFINRIRQALRFKSKEED